mmetsp:Transcript_11360/g.36021  ORF Transcript_11360/g.36021 Transcript_11360/m.36021 type:complete len:220 (-) Transcript_11360:215-874(-)
MDGGTERARRSRRTWWCPSGLCLCRRRYYRRRRRRWAQRGPRHAVGKEKGCASREGGWLPKRDTPGARPGAKEGWRVVEKGGRGRGGVCSWPIHEKKAGAGWCDRLLGLDVGGGRFWREADEFVGEVGGERGEGGSGEVDEDDGGKFRGRRGGDEVRVAGGGRGGEDEGGGLCDGPVGLELAEVEGDDGQEGEGGEGAGREAHGVGAVRGGGEEGDAEY